MSSPVRKRVVAIPVASTPLGAAVAGLVAAERCEMVLGVQASARIGPLDVFMDQGVAYTLRVDLDRAKSVDDFFKIGIAQFGRLDTVVVEAIELPTREPMTEKTIGASTQRLLHCLDAALRYAEGNLHIIHIAPLAGRYASPIATAFLGAKLATTPSKDAPSLRLSVVSPSDGQGVEDGSLARTIVHMMCEPQSPNVVETVLRRGAPWPSYPRPQFPRMKTTVPM